VAGKAHGTMGKQSQRISTRLSLDFIILAVSIVIIALGVWIGFEGAPFLNLLSKARRDSARAVHAINPWPLYT
jgi:hypothetical protein